ncbi:hypothetical protein [Ferrimonas marina]|uniref:Uncharacterized protein n=1 Tax=Ferrimonas marina TaxID=299255 RepID=A0A1M5YTP8_9GAMM|nr:hypothetical protein [Ferrimonas marina]SHI14963.1 hypothetical protein SAMN02745129_4377 [Ferrimonas marina]
MKKGFLFAAGFVAAVSTSAIALQGTVLFPDADDNGNFLNVGWSAADDGGLILHGDNKMEAVLTVSNTRDGQGPRAPTFKVVGRNEDKDLNNALPLVQFNNIENNAAAVIELTNNKNKRGIMLGWSIMNTKGGDFVLRNKEGAGNWINISFYKLSPVTFFDANGAEITAMMHMPYCPDPIVLGDKERVLTCPE